LRGLAQLVLDLSAQLTESQQQLALASSEQELLRQDLAGRTQQLGALEVQLRRTAAQSSTAAHQAADSKRRLEHALDELRACRRRADSSEEERQMLETQVRMCACVRHTHPLSLSV
jgi:septal ring factor EnvC (AmiA/AmiB activator)